ncbi:Rieske (2Fe-2S) protein, partial [bacterium]|nr:Rieske (2Fe-2S) protein [bacterium]
TAEERELELERRTSRAILVASYAELSEAKGRYFIAYDMAPGLAFRGADGLPIVRSAKCTHLGCTVSSELDGQGRVLCPCHVSYFDIVSGRPNEGAPAKAPLPGLAWALIDAAGAVVASAAADGVVQGSREAARLAGCNLYITKPEGWS